MADAYMNDSITVPGAVAMGTGVMIGAGIFALTGQIAEPAAPIFALTFSGIALFGASNEDALAETAEPALVMTIRYGRKQGNQGHHNAMTLMAFLDGKAMQ